MPVTSPVAGSLSGICVFRGLFSPVADCHSPHVVTFAVRLLLFDKTGATFVQELLTLGTLEAGGVPLHVWCNLQDELVQDLGAAPVTRRDLQSRIFCRHPGKESV